MKKVIFLLVLVLLVSALFPLSALARGHHGRIGGMQSVRRYAFCDVVDCARVGTHRHGGVCYYGYRAEERNRGDGYGTYPSGSGCRGCYR